MSYQIAIFKQFHKAVKKLRRSGKPQIVVVIEEVVQLLKQSDEDVRTRWMLFHQWKDHPLRGGHREKRELHLDQDILLLYRRDEERKLIELLDIVTHEELRKKG